MDDLDHDIFNLTDEQPVPGPGALLVAKPTVGDDVFARSVIVLVNHDDAEGSMGLMVNRLTNYTLADVMPDVPCAAAIPLYLGGPVDLQVMFFLHTLGAEVIPEAVEVSPGLWLGGDGDAMVRYLSSGAPVEGRVKFIVGYSGWSAGQLADEIARHDWVVVNSWRRAVVMDNDYDTIWQSLVGAMGPRYRLWLNLPDDPRFN